MKNNHFYYLLFAGAITLYGSAVLGQDILPDDFIGQKYQVLREALLKQGWLPDMQHSDPEVYPEYPEIACGSGKNAICSAGFALGDRYEAVMVEVKDGELIVSGSY